MKINYRNGKPKVFHTIERIRREEIYEETAIENTVWKKLMQRQGASTLHAPAHVCGLPARQIRGVPPRQSHGRSRGLCHEKMGDCQRSHALYTLVPSAARQNGGKTGFLFRAGQKWVRRDLFCGCFNERGSGRFQPAKRRGSLYV